MVTFSYTFSNWEGIILGLIPIVVNLILLGYTFLNFKKHLIYYTFSAFVIFLIFWQLGDLFLRISANSYTAQFWTNLFILSPLFITIIGLHFVLQISRFKKYTANPFFIIFQYFPILIFNTLIRMGIFQVPVKPVSFWGWVTDLNHATLAYDNGLIVISICAILMVVVLADTFFTTKDKNIKKTAAILLGGEIIPIVFGVSAQILLPIYLKLDQIPITTSLATFFSMASFIAIKKYGLTVETLKVTAESIVKSSTDIIITIGPNNEIQFINRYGASFFGLIYTEHTSTHQPAVFNADPKTPLFQVIKSVREGSSVRIIKTDLVSSFLEKIPFSITASALAVEGQEVPSVMVVGRNVSELMRTEDALKKNAEELQKFKLAAEEAYEHIIITDANGSIIYANNGVERTTGYSKEEIIGKNPAVWGGQMPEQFYKDLWSKIKTQKLPFSGEILNRKKNGDLYYADTRISPILDAEGEVKYFVGLERDVTAEKNTLKTIENEVAQRTKELYQEKTKLKVSIDSLSIGFIITDTNSNVVSINGAAKNLLCAPENESHPGVYKRLEDIVQKCEIEDIERNFKDSFDLRTHVLESVSLKKPLDFKDVSFRNSYFHIMITPVIVVENNFEVIGSVVVVENVTEEKLQQRSRDEFFSIASHELRTPLTAIRGNTSMIEQFYGDELKDPQLKEMVDDIHSSSVRLIEIVNDFLDSSRLEQGKMEFKLEKFDLKILVNEVIKELENTIDREKVKLFWNNPADYIPLVWADKNKVKQVLLNLIGNALKFTENGTVIIKTEYLGHYIKVFVTDTGKGISAENQHLLFRKFQQAGDSLLTRDSTRGTGLGLYISKLIMQGMGGNISLEKSEPGVGSTFSFSVLTEEASKSQSRPQVATA